MKNILSFLIIIVLFGLLGCTQPVSDNVTKKYYTTTGSVSDDAVVVKVYPEEGVTMSGAAFKAMSNAPMKALITEQHDPEVDFANGILYYDNSYQYYVANSLDPDRTLDLSPIIGAKANIVYLLVRYVDGCEDESAELFFKPYGYNVNYSSMQIRGSLETEGMCTTITDSLGRLNWYHTYSWQFNHSGVWKAKQIEIYAIFYTNGIIIQANE
jgi:hypothetical protein